MNWSDLNLAGLPNSAIDVQFRSSDRPQEVQAAGNLLPHSFGGGGLIGVFDAATLTPAPTWSKTRGTT